MGFEGFPLIVGWELTLICNLRCRHCASSAGQPRPQELSPDEALAICDQFPALLVQEVDFTGGEPLLRPDWPAIATRLRDLDIRTKVITNGLVLKPSVIEQIKDTGISGVGVSLDGLAATHEIMRGCPGLFHRALSGIEQVQKAGLPVTVLTTITGLNIHELPAMYDLLCSMGITAWQLQPIFPLGRAHENNGLELSQQAYLEMGAFVRQCWLQMDGRGLKIEPADSFGYYTDLDPRVPPWRGCPAGQLACGITSDGKVKGCLSLPDHLIEGDLRQHDLWDIWFHPDAFAYTRQFAPQDLGQHCQACPMADACRGGCSAMSYGQTGQFHNNPCCFLAIEQRRQEGNHDKGIRALAATQSGDNPVS